MIIMADYDKYYNDCVEDIGNEEPSSVRDEQIPELFDEESINDFINSLEDWD